VTAAIIRSEWAVFALLYSPKRLPNSPYRRVFARPTAAMHRVSRGGADMAKLVTPTQQMAYNIEQTAQLLGLAPNTVRRLIRDGELPCRRVGVRVLISRAALEKFLATSSHKKTPHGAA